MTKVEELEAYMKSLDDLMPVSSVKLAAAMSRQHDKPKKKAQKSCVEEFTFALEHAGVFLLSIPPTGGRFIGKGRFVHKKVTADLVGSLKTGRPIIADCKTCSKDRLYINDCFTDREHQRDEIIECGIRGWIAGLLIESTKLHLWYWCPSTLLRKTSIEWRGLHWLGPTTASPVVSRIWTP